MLENLLGVIQQEGVSEQLFHSLIGIEIEENRIDKAGRLSTRPHPTALGSRTFHPYVQSDFGESQTELITDPNPNIGGVLDQLDTLQTVLFRTLEGDDRIWPLSMPPAVSEADRETIKSHFGRPAYRAYRDYLTKKYGVDRKIVTGVHINFSLPDPVINRLFGHYQDQFDHVTAFKNALYFQLAQNMVLNRWLLTYLFGASPVAEKGYFESMGTAPLSGPARSLRNSQYGYSNQPADGVGAGIYQSLPAFIETLEKQVAAGVLYSQAEFYGPVRFRGQKALPDYLTRGIKYLEFRVFDNTPYTSNGVSRHALNFLKIYFLYLMVTPVTGSTLEADLQAAERLNNKVALEDPTSHTIAEQQGRQIFDELHDLAVKLAAHSEQLTALDDFSEVMTHPELTPAAKLTKHIKNGSLMEYGVTRAAQLKAERTGAADLLPVFSRLSVRAQELIFRAVQLGVRYYEVRDENGESMLMMTFDGMTQVVSVDFLPEEDATTYLKRLFPDLPVPTTR